MATKRINKIWNEIFVGGFFLNGLGFVLDDNFVVVDFDNLFSGNSEFGVGKTLNERTSDDELLDGIIFTADGKISDATESGAFFGFDSITEGVEFEVNSLRDFDDVVF